MRYYQADEPYYYNGEHYMPEYVTDEMVEVANVYSQDDYYNQKIPWQSGEKDIAFNNNVSHFSSGDEGQSDRIQKGWDEYAKMFQKLNFLN